MNIFVIHIDESPQYASVRNQLDAWSMEYIPVPALDHKRATPAALIEKYGSAILDPAQNPYESMELNNIARTAAWSEVCERMLKENMETACVLYENTILFEDFPKIVQSPQTTQADWDILILGSLKRSKSLLSGPYKRQSLFGEYQIGRPNAVAWRTTGFMIRHQTAQQIRALSLPIREDLRSVIHSSIQYGIRIRALQPSCLHWGVLEESPPPAETTRACRENFLSELYSDACAQIISQIEPTPMHNGHSVRALLQKRLFSSRSQPPEPQRWIMKTPMQWGWGSMVLRPRPLPKLQPGWKPEKARKISVTSASIAVVIPLFNRAKYILAVLENLCRQSHAPQRVIVVDDGSDDNGPQLVEKYFSDEKLPFAGLLLRQQKNRGAAAARNLGLLHAEDSEYIYFLDSDDFPPVGFLQEALEALHQNRHAVAATADALFLRGENRMRFESRTGLSRNPWQWFLQNGAPIASATLLRRDVLSQSGLFNENLPTGHDVDLFSRIAKYGDWLHLCGHPVMMMQTPHHDHLHKSYPDYLRQWAYIWEKSILRDAAERVDRSLQKNSFAAIWRRAAEQLLKADNIPAANECLRRSLAWKTCNPSLFYLLPPGRFSMGRLYTSLHSKLRSKLLQMLVRH